MNDFPESSLSCVFSSDQADIPVVHGNVFLPGWGFDGRVITLQDQVTGWSFPTTALSPPDTIQALAAYLEQHQIASIVLTGWSMGSYLALDFALQYPEKIEALYLLGMRKSWPLEEIRQISRALQDDRDAFMKTFYRKCFLGYRKAHDRFKTEIEPSLIAGLQEQDLEAGLEYLATYKVNAQLSSLADLPFPAHIINGGKDIIAPVDQAPVSGNTITTTLGQGGHPLFLEQDFPFSLHHRKASIRNKFSRAADTYDAHAIIQQEIAARLGELLPSGTVDKILEIGCGTGNYTDIVSNKFPGAAITAIDFADDMLALARKKTAPGRSVNYLCCDAEQYLHQSEERFDLITSNATIQWFDNLASASRNLRSRLTIDGSILLSIFGPESMQEMRQGLAEITGRTASLASAYFPNQDKIFTIFEPLFKDLEINQWQIERKYKSMAELLEHIRKTGTSGWHPGRPLLTRTRMLELEKWFLEEYGKCCITYQVFQISGRRK